jgi:hypothetical protein
VLYDVTTLYFEAENEDELRKVGYSKERRVDPQIVVGLLVDRAGFPLEIGCWEGNKAETATMIPIIRQFQDRHSIEATWSWSPTPGCCPRPTSRTCTRPGCGSSSAPGHQGPKLTWPRTSAGTGTRSPTGRSSTPSPRGWHHRRARCQRRWKRAEPVWDPGEHDRSWRAVWAYSAKRAARDAKTLTLQENRAKAVIAGEKAARTPRFVTVKNGSRSLDETSLARARRAGRAQGVRHQHPRDVMPAGEVIASYHELWHVERRSG